MPPPPARAARAEREARLDALGLALESVRLHTDVAVRFQSDPVEFVHRYPRLHDKELVALGASSLAFGNVKAMRAKIQDALTRIGPDVARVADDPEDLAARLRGWKHRVYRDQDLARLLVGGRRVQRAHGTLGDALIRELDRTGTLRGALSAWTTAIRQEGGLDRTEPGRRGGAHILADPAKGSAVKRLMLLLRWMARPADGVDLGLWSIPPSRLLMPVDTHIHKLGKNLALTERKDVSWTTAEEITAALRRFDAKDPVKYDFPLCHLGMLQRCPSRRDEARCEGCGVQSVCRHWAREPKKRRASPAARRAGSLPP
jgi:uncharacterized protein (TIGR02757 family)